MTLPSLVAKWGPVLALGVAIGGGLSAGAVWVYKVDTHVAWGARRSGEVETAYAAIEKRTSNTEAAMWALLYWARQVSKKEGWPEPPTVMGMEKPADVKVVPPYRPGMYAAELPPKENP